MEVVLALIIIVGIIFWATRSAQVHSSHIQTKLGPLQYTSGNSLNDNYGRTFHGIEVTLPKKLPHIYVDGHNTDSVLHGPRYVFKDQSRLSLEGDFDTHFQVYAVSHYHRVVLGILQPNVMAQLVDILADYDVEIWQNKLRIISNKKVYNKDIEPQLQALAIALTNNISPTIRRWKQSEEEESGSLQMSLQRDSMTKFGHRSVSSFTLLSAVLMAVIASPVAFLGYLLNVSGGGGEYLYFGAFLIFPCLWIFFAIAQKHGWLDNIT